jgi:hypothetical protein
VQRLAARGQDAHGRRCLQELPGRIGAAVQQVLAVVEHDERPALRDLRQQVALGHAQRRGDRERHMPLVGDRGELDQPDAVRVSAQGFAGDVQRKARLAGAARARESDNARLAEQLATSPVSASRPTKLLTCAGRLWGGPEGGTDGVPASGSSVNR